VVLTVIVGFLFFQLGHDQVGVQNRYSLLFFISLNQAFTLVNSGAMIFHQEKGVVARERSAGAYRVSSYFVAKTAADLPVVSFAPLLHAIIIYWMTDLNGRAGAFFTYVLVFFVGIIAAQSYGLVISALTPTYEVASVIVPVSMVLVILFGGFYLRNQSVWIGFVWLQYLSFIKYIYAALVVNEFQDTTWSCDTSYQCLDTGEKVLDSLGMDGMSIWQELGKLIALGVGFRVIAYLALLLLRKERLRLR